MGEHMIYIIIIHVSAIIADILVLSALGHMVYQRREPTSLIAWLLAIILLPYIAVPLYFVFRSRKRKKKAKAPIKLACRGEVSPENATSLDMILEKTSGISILDGQPSIRGGSGFSYGVGSRVLMLVDDLPMISGDAGDIKWNYLPVENINQIEIIKGSPVLLI